jgi:hypothetical protein
MVGPNREAMIEAVIWCARRLMPESDAPNENEIRVRFAVSGTRRQEMEFIDDRPAVADFPAAVLGERADPPLICLSPVELAIVAALKRGAMKGTALARRVGIQRTRLYILAHNLCERGVLAVVHHGGYMLAVDWDESKSHA